MEAADEEPERPALETAAAQPEAATERVRCDRAGAADDSEIDERKHESVSAWGEPPAGRFGIGRAERPLVDHFVGKSAVAVELFEQLDGYVRGLGDDITRRVRRQHIEYSRGRDVCFVVEIRR